jgi:hypothetical protein
MGDSEDQHVLRGERAQKTPRRRRGFLECTG